MTDQLTVVVSAAYSTLDKTHATVRSALAQGLPCLVADIDGEYLPVENESVLALAELSGQADSDDITRAALATLDSDELAFYAAVLGGRRAFADGATSVALLAPGVHLCGSPAELSDAAVGGAAVLPRRHVEVLARRRAPGTMIDHAAEFGPVDPDEISSGSLFTRSLVVMGDEQNLDALISMAGDWRLAGSALDSYAAANAATIIDRPGALLATWSIGSEAVISDIDGQLHLDGVPVIAVDLTQFDPAKPWILDQTGYVEPALLLSAHPALRAVIDTVTAGWRPAPDLDYDALPPRVLADRVVMHEVRRASLLGGDAPDLYGSDDPRKEIRRWANDLVPPTHRRPVSRYLAGVRAIRKDLMKAFPNVPGDDTEPLAQWALRSGVNETGHGINIEMLREAAETTLAAQPLRGARKARGTRPEGVNIVGYLSGELGLGESGRLMTRALASSGEATSTFDVSHRLLSRQSATYETSEPNLYDTTLLCINGGETPDVIKQLGDVLDGSHRIGMWYWELEEFPRGHAAGFKHVDEVWVATDFIRESVSALSPGTPVRTVMPPLPQREGEAGVLPERFGIDPERPFFLFTFDFLSLAGRKNPYGLVEAFEKAFPDELPGGPQLVIKTINGNKAASDAERLRLQMAGRGDLILVDEYLPNDERHVLVAHCFAFVSLHRAEGLGLTIAEAMAWGKPVISTRYGGPTQFLNDENSLQVGWTRSFVPEDMGPYEKGRRWAEPDLDEAAKLMRRLIADPAAAAAIGEQGARDIRDLHHPTVAGARIKELLAEGRTEREATRAAERAVAERKRAMDLAAARRPLVRRAASRARREWRDYLQRRRTS